VESMLERNLARLRTGRASPLAADARETATPASSPGGQFSALQREDGVLFLVTLVETQPGVFTEVTRRRV